MYMETSPPIIAADAGAPPLYGTWVMRILAMKFSSSPAKCGTVPEPPELKLNCPGRVLM